jgi:hypothetical protein
MPKNNPPEDHYFLPVFYLSRWQRDEAPIVEFALRGNGKIEGRTCYPRGTAYKPRLYSNEFEPNGAKAQALETEFMQDLDRKAAETLELFDKKSTWTNEEGSNWSRFVWSLLFRVPEEVAEFRRSYLEFFQKVTSPDEDRYTKMRVEGMPETLVEFLEQRRGLAESSSLDTLKTLIDHFGLVQLLNGMVWTTLITPESKFEFLTSDRPVLMTASLGENNAYMLLPLGPRRIFAATKDHATMKLLRNKSSHTDFVRIVNTQVVSHAFKCAYGSDSSQLRFVQNHLATKKFEPIFSRLYRAMKDQYPRLR